MSRAKRLRAILFEPLGCRASLSKLVPHLILPRHFSDTSDMPWGLTKTQGVPKNGPSTNLRATFFIRFAFRYVATGAFGFEWIFLAVCLIL